MRPLSKSRTNFMAWANSKLDSGETAAAPTPTYSELLGQTLAKFADNNKKITAITAAMPSGTGLVHFAAKHPDQYFDVGIAEEHAALFACGYGDRRIQTVSDDLLDLHAARL